MSVDLKDADREKTDVSRRAFLAGLTTLAVGAAVLSLGVDVANAATEIDVPAGSKDPTRNKTSAENKKVEVVQNVNPNDPLQAFNQPYYRHRRRVARRGYRRGRRVVRRTYRRVRRRVVY
jgi:hypothetical protein